MRLALAAIALSTTPGLAQVAPAPPPAAAQPTAAPAVHLPGSHVSLPGLTGFKPGADFAGLEHPDKEPIRFQNIPYSLRD